MAQLTLQQAANELELEGFDVWFTPGKTGFRTNASMGLTVAILAGSGRVVKHNTSFSKSATGEFVTLVK